MVWSGVIVIQGARDPDVDSVAQSPGSPVYVTPILPGPPPAGALAEEEASVVLQGDDGSSLNEKVWPAIVTVPVREAEPVFGAIAISTSPLPVADPAMGPLTT